MVGFEPTGLTPQQISSLRRYDHFGTSPYYGFNNYTSLSFLFYINIITYFIIKIKKYGELDSSPYFKLEFFPNRLFHSNLKEESYLIHQ